jgi:hypothetical protein
VADQPPGLPGPPAQPAPEDRGRPGLGLRLRAKFNKISIEQQREADSRMARYKSQLPRPTTTAELNEVNLRDEGRFFASLLGEGEDLRGIPSFELTGNIPRPPADRIHGDDALTRIGRAYEHHLRVENRRYRHGLLQEGTWLGGDWDSEAGKFALAVGVWPLRPRWDFPNYLVVTSRRVLVTSDIHFLAAIHDGQRPEPCTRQDVQIEYPAGHVTVRPGWPATAKNNRYRVDLSFPDGSWIGVESTGGAFCAVGSAPDSSRLYRNLIAELLGYPVTAL